MGIYVVRALFVLVGICIAISGISFHFGIFVAGVLFFLYVTIFEGDEICSRDVWGWLGAACFFMLVGYITAQLNGITVWELQDHREIYRRFRGAFAFGVFSLGMSLSELVFLVYVTFFEKE